MSDKHYATVAVTGVTGALGSRIAVRLADRGVPQLLVGRSPDRMPDLPGAQRRGPAGYGDASAMREALEGASTLILVSGHRTGRRWRNTPRRSRPRSRSAWTGSCTCPSSAPRPPPPT
ncbi:hypothetical protein ACFQ51_40330 [Streptomyces kaempferi]